MKIIKKFLALTLSIAMLIYCNVAYGKVVFVSILQEDDNIVKFKDKNFENIIRTEINKPKGDILRQDLETIKDLKANNKNITSIEGIQYLIYVESIDLRNNKIMDISPLQRSFFNLRTLYLANNKIIDYTPVIPFYNRLQNIDFYLNIPQVKLSIQDISYPSINLSWTELYLPPIYIKVVVSINNSEWLTIKNSDIIMREDSNKVTIMNLKPNTKYKFKLYIVNELRSEYSSETSFITDKYYK